jgi:hypothetical protein
MMMRTHKLLTGGLWLLMATGCGGETTEQADAGWMIEERQDMSAPDQDTPDQDIQDLPIAADMPEDQQPDMSGPQCAQAQCQPIGCGAEIRCGADEPGLTPCPSAEWGVFSDPIYRCGCETGTCAPPRCLNNAECAADELCLLGTPAGGMSPQPGTCVQTSCGALTSMYDAVAQQDVVSCQRDDDCEVYVPSYECCRGWPIPKDLRYEAEKIDVYIQRVRCDDAVRRQCELVDCAPPQEARCDQTTNRCVLGQ